MKYGDYRNSVPINSLIAVLQKKMAPVKRKINVTYTDGEICEPFGVKNAPNTFIKKISLVLTTAVPRHFAAPTAHTFHI